jgi:putative peptidoglycan lipid II flippase
MISAFKRPFRFLSREVRGMHEAAYLLAGFSLASQILALLRDRVFAAQFGVGHTLDLYYAAFRVPDFLFATVASLFSLYALLPILTRIETESEGKMVAFVRGVLAVFFAGMSFISVIIYIFVPYLTHFLAPGITDPLLQAQLVVLTRILLLQPILLGASNTIAALTQLRHRFVLYSISPLLYNLGIIFGATILYKHMGIAALGWGVVIGAVLHLAIQLPYFLTEWPNERLNLSRTLSGVWEVLKLSIPRTLSLASTQISLLIIVALASLLSSGSIAVLSFALNLQAVPLTIIGVSYSVAAFPTLAKLFAQGDREAFVHSVEAALRHIIFWSVPATVFFIVLRAQIVRVILGSGQFDWSATRLTAAALALFVVSLTAQSLILLIARTYYAAGNTRKPLYFGCADITVSISSSVALLSAFHHSELFRSFVETLLRVSDVPGTDVLMLALGYALGSIVECIFAYVYCMRDMKVPHGRITRLMFESFASSIIGGTAAYMVLDRVGTYASTSTTLSIVIQGLLAGSVGLVVTVFLLWLLGNRELQESIDSVRRKFKDVPVDTTSTALEPTDAA